MVILSRRLSGPVGDCVSFLPRHSEVRKRADCMLGRRTYGIVSALGEGMTTKDAPNGFGSASHYPVLRDGFHRVLGAGWSIAAGHREQRRDQILVQPQQQYGDLAH